jgi:hypothetical protein
LQKEIPGVSRIFLTGVLAIAFLFVGSVAVIWWSTEGGEAPVAPQTEQPAAPERLAAAARAVPPSALPSVLPTALAVERAGGAPARELAADPPEASPRETKAGPSPQAPRPAFSRQVTKPAPPQQVGAERRRALVSFRQEIKTGLPPLGARLARCGRDLSDTSFVLTMEGVDAGARIADVRVDERGSASDAEVACALSALRGQLIPSSSAVPGSHWEMAFSPAAAVTRSERALRKP